MTPIKDLTIRDYLDQVSARNPTPGGGAVAAIIAAEGCALMNMVANFSEGEEFKKIVSATDKTLDALTKAGEADQDAFGAVMRAYRGQGDREAALSQAALVPAGIIGLCSSRLDHLEALAARGNPRLISDVAIAALLFDAAIKSSELNILINLRELDHPPEEAISVLRDLPTISVRLQDIVNTVRMGLS